MGDFDAISTKRLLIQPFEYEDLTPNYVSWLNDAHTMRYSEQRHLSHSIESCSRYWRSFHETENWFLAVHRIGDTTTHIGNISVVFDLPNGTVDMSILIGEKASQGQGFGQEAWQCILARLLAITSIRKVTAGTMAANKAMICVAHNSGMFYEGLRSRQFLLDGAETDLVQFAKFAPEY